MTQTTARQRGRPREFDTDAVLDRAVDAFWAHGYGSTSVDDLVETMGINRPSLYGSFGSKHDLFLAAIDRYVRTLGREPIDAFLAAPNVKRAAQAFFDATIKCVTRKNRPHGCLVMSVASVQAATDVAVRDKLTKLHNATVRTVAKKIETAQRDGRLPAYPAADELARMIVSVRHALAARARAGASRRELDALARNFIDLLFRERAAHR
ncbi:MAG: TetR/AcrR family transcriptional regulator [Pseudolabrys sp.]